jgi:uncharacterized membrane protein YqhA
VNFDKLEHRLTRLRYVSIIAVVASGFGALLMFVIGAVKVVRAYKTYFTENLLAGTAALDGANAAIAYLIQAIDAFLIAIGLMIFAGGIYNLFIHAVPKGRRNLFGIESITHLKSLLAELIIVILMVKFLEEALHSREGYEWDIIILPVGVVLIAIAVRVLRFRDYRR